MPFRLIIAALIPLLVSCQGTGSAPVSSLEPATPETVSDTYIRIARAAYEDSLITARDLDAAVARFVREPSPRTLELARNAWLAARVPYMQTEAFRFGNPVVDEWEVRVNSWPLDEGLIDYVAPSYGRESDNNYFYTANIIANEKLSIGGIEVDAGRLTPAFLSGTLHNIDGVESNVATGYHAIEFLLWGQDLNGTDPGAGDRPWTDYSPAECTNGHCDRRRAYLRAATQLLVADLQEMAAFWQSGGAAYEDFMAKPPDARLATMLTGMGSLAYGELAGERIRLGLLLNDPEEEHDCFSDNTHNSHYYDALSIANVYRGEYRRVDGGLVSGASLEDLVRAADPAVLQDMESALAETEAAMSAIVDQARQGNTFDVLIAADNEEGEAVVNRAVDALVAETRAIENVVRALGLANVSIQGSDSLSGPGF